MDRSGDYSLYPERTFSRKPKNKSFIDFACSVKVAGYWPRSFFAFLWTSTSSRSINTQKTELGQYPAILTSYLVNNPYISERPRFLAARNIKRQSYKFLINLGMYHML